MLSLSMISYQIQKLSFLKLTVIFILFCDSFPSPPTPTFYFGFDYDNQMQIMLNTLITGLAAVIQRIRFQF